jgi:lipid-binding SYLF domain-containing protein
MKRETLTDLYKEKPKARKKIEDAEGYGVFAELAYGTGIGGGGNGYGVVVNNATGERTYMRMLQASGGVGIGIKEFRVIFVFHDQDALQKFVTEGWEVGSEAEASALVADTGAGAEAAGIMNRGVSVYQFTDQGLYVRAALHAKKFYPDKDLNDG